MSLPENDKRPHRQIRSYVLREGRLTPGQQRAFETLWPRWGLEFRSKCAGSARSSAMTSRCTSRSASAMARASPRWRDRHPERNYLGVEVHGPGVGHLLLKLEEFGCTNVRVIRHDAVEVLEPHARRRQPRGRLPVLPRPVAKKTSSQTTHPADTVSRRGWRESFAPVVIYMPPPTGRTTPSRCSRCSAPTATHFANRGGPRQFHPAPRVAPADEVRTARPAARPWRLGSDLHPAPVSSLRIERLPAPA